jgi:hypothetical protein
MLTRAGAREEAPVEPLHAEIARLEAENAHLRRAPAGVPLAPDGPRAAPEPSGPALAARPAKPDPLRAPAGATATDPVPLWVEGLRKAVAAGDDSLRNQFRMALVAYGERAARALAPIALDRMESIALRSEALTALFEMKAAGRLDVALEILARLDEEDVLRTSALRVAAEAAGPKAPDYAAIRDATGPGRPLAERQQAIQVVLSGDPRAALAVIEEMLSSRVPEERDVALELLSGVNHPDFRPLVTSALATAPAARRQELLAALARTKGPGWAAGHATGEPDTLGHGDIQTAWASKGPDMGEVWLELDYDEAVRPEAVRVHETYNPGAVARVESKGADGRWEVLWEGTAPAPANQSAWFEPRLSAGTRTRSIRLVLDTNRVAGWNEIDAVELVGDGRRQWASAARASSSYPDP